MTEKYLKGGGGGAKQNCFQNNSKIKKNYSEIKGGHWPLY